MSACEVCGTAGAQAVLITCSRCPTRCHSYCLPGPHVAHSIPQQFLCYACCEPAEASPQQQQQQQQQQQARPGSSHEPASRLLQLPDACLLEVLRCCADDPRSLFSAARAHSRLHQVAVQLASSITAVVPKQQRVNSVQQYLIHHGQHVSSIHLDKGPTGRGRWLRYLPHDKLQGLSSLSITSFEVQLWPTSTYGGVLRADLPLKQLRLDRCTLLDREKGKALVAALSALPNLQHLSFAMTPGCQLRFPSHVLQAQQQLTFLELADVQLKDPEGLQHLQGLTRLQELQLQRVDAKTLQASILSSMQQLSALKLHSRPYGCNRFELGILSSKPCLQHLEIVGYWKSGGWLKIRVAEMLSHLHSLQQLTHLELSGSQFSQDPAPPAAAFAALTASSKLRHLDIRSCAVPTSAWQHIFPAGRQLPHLQMLYIVGVCKPSDHAVAVTAPIASGSSLVSCCPGLQSLTLSGLRYSRELLAPLTGLSSLTALGLQPAGESCEGLEALNYLTGLRRLHLVDTRGEGGLLQLTQLKQLTYISYIYRHAPGCYGGPSPLCQEAPSDEPVWRQMLQLLVRHGDPAMASQAAAKLAE